MLTGSMLLSIIETILISFVLLLGVAAGIYVIAKKLKKIGILMVVGFLLLLLEPGVKLIVYQLILPNLSHRNAMAFIPWYAMTACLSTLVNIAGFACLLAAIFFAIQPKLQADKATEFSLNSITPKDENGEEQ